MVEVPTLAPLKVLKVQGHASVRGAPITSVPTLGSMGRQTPLAALAVPPSGPVPSARAVLPGAKATQIIQGVLAKLPRPLEEPIHVTSLAQASTAPPLPVAAASKQPCGEDASARAQAVGPEATPTSSPAQQSRAVTGAPAVGARAPHEVALVAAGAASSSPGEPLRGIGRTYPLRIKESGPLVLVRGGPRVAPSTQGHPEAPPPPELIEAEAKEHWEWIWASGQVRRAYWLYAIRLFKHHYRRF